MGVGDQVPQAIEQLGATVQMIGPGELSGGDLTNPTSSSAGVRAYERRADLRANNHRLLAYAERGGTVLVQCKQVRVQRGAVPDHSRRR